jgi:2-polyprenyl-3-methyl-5-hydroxy-6-metoxy-1,4-benzoquinol methylase
VNARDYLEQLSAQITREYPVLANGLLPNRLPTDDPLWEWATIATEHVLRITGADEAKLAQCAESFVVTSLDFLRLQARFVKTGRYAKASACETATIYADSETMTDYLDGLALTYAMWPNHARLLEFFTRTLVPALPSNAHVLEVGPGHGLFAAVLLDRRSDVAYTGVDISPRSISYSAGALAATGIAPGRYDLVVGDATDTATIAASQFTGAICCEVLEHVDDPRALLAQLRACVAGESPVFVSTVANMEAEDHVYLFHDADDIRTTIRASGFTVESDQPLPLAGAEALEREPLNYSALLRA